MPGKLLNGRDELIGDDLTQADLDYLASRGSRTETKEQAWYRTRYPSIFTTEKDVDPRDRAPSGPDAKSRVQDIYLAPEDEKRQGQKKALRNMRKEK